MLVFKSSEKLKKYLSSGEPMVWFSATAFASILLMIFVLFTIVLYNGIRTFWPAELVLINLENGTQLLGEEVQRDKDESKAASIQFKVGNRDVSGQDFIWIKERSITSNDRPARVYALERFEHGNFYGNLVGLNIASSALKTEGSIGKKFSHAMAISKVKAAEIKTLQDQISNINGNVEALRQKLHVETNEEEKTSIRHAIANYNEGFETTLTQMNQATADLDQNYAVFETVAGERINILFSSVVRFYQPNAMSIGQKMAYYFSRVVEVFIDDPRESNTEGGLFPAIFGTALLVFMMAITSFPLGVLGGIYLKEYAREGWLVNIVRIAVNNLAGIPSIVYGIFGLGFFIYGVGASIDQMFFAERLPESTFGTGGILWASMTLGILTIPVVIVATEEALGAIPAEVRSSSYALGATKLQTLFRVILPMASPGIMTGFILAMARAAGEVAPLMITGVVKLAPTLPIDGFWPFVHLDRKFMHLGFHIYDISSQSPNVEAAKPMVYVTTLLLIAIVVVMSGSAIWLRNRMRKKYQPSAL